MPREPARPRCGTWRHWEATSPAASLLVLPVHDLIARRRAESPGCHAHEGENQYHAGHNNSTCAMVHPSSTAVPLLAMTPRWTDEPSRVSFRAVSDSMFTGESLIKETVRRPAESLLIFVPQHRAAHDLPIRSMVEGSFDCPLVTAGIVW